MTQNSSIGGALIATSLIATGLIAAPLAASAQTLLETAAEHRFQLDFHVNDAALAKMLPQGWETVIATQGAAKDANLRMIFIDRMGIAGGDGKPTKQATSRLVYLAIPVKQSAGAGVGQMIIYGLAEDAADAPGAFGTYQAASIAKMSRSASASGGVARGTEDWEFVGAAGERMEAHVEYQRGPVAKGGAETKFYNPSDPAKFLLFKTDQAIDIMKNPTTNPPDHISKFSYKAGGGKIAALFDGTEKVVSWDSFPWYIRTISAP